MIKRDNRLDVMCYEAVDEIVLEGNAVFVD